MAGKNPKRVAAGKKAWRNRGKGKKRGSSRSTARRGKKRHTRGITGRIGAVVLGVMPPVLAGIEATASTIATKKNFKLNGISTVQFGLMRWLNNLTMGFLGKPAFGDKEIMTFADEDGKSKKFAVGSGLPGGSLWLVAGTGLLLMLYDAVAARLAGGSPVKIPFTAINATGSA